MGNKQSKIVVGNWADEYGKKSDYFFVIIDESNLDILTDELDYLFINFENEDMVERKIESFLEFNRNTNSFGFIWKAEFTLDEYKLAKPFSFYDDKKHWKGKREYPIWFKY